MKWSLQATVAAQNGSKKLTGCSVYSQSGPYAVKKSIVRSQLEYSYPVWSPNTVQDKLESTQRAFTHYNIGSTTGKG